MIFDDLSPMSLGREVWFAKEQRFGFFEGRADRSTDSFDGREKRREKRREERGRVCVTREWLVWLEKSRAMFA